jgi:ribosomal protein L31E
MLVQRDPSSTISYLLQLLALAKKPNHKMAEQAIIAIKDLLTKH